MAPSVVASPPVEGTASLELSEKAFPRLSFVGGPKSFNKAGELNGTQDQPAASYPNYLPVWDNESTK